MKRFRLTREQYLPLGLEEVFAFFADAGNLEKLTPPWLHFAMRTTSPVAMRPGTLIDYRLRVRGVPVYWQSEITRYEPPFRFADVQRKGPYTLWEHTHSFEALGTGTVVRDDVIYAVPGGAVINRLLVAPDLRRIFDYRARQLDTWVLARIRQAEGALPGAEGAAARVSVIG